VHDWSRHYNSIAQEQPRQVGVMPDRMPSLESCKEMLDHAEKMTISIRRMQETILAQKHAAADQRMREQGAKAMGEYDDDVSMYGDERPGQVFSGPEGKKRKGVRNDRPYHAQEPFLTRGVESSTSRPMP
jgi:hypothetical protein